MIAAHQRPIERLTPRQLEVLHLIAAGLRRREIATRLVISQDTVKQHSDGLKAKLGARTLAEAVYRAVQAGLFEVAEPCPRCKVAELYDRVLLGPDGPICPDCRQDVTPDEGYE